MSAVSNSALNALKLNPPQKVKIKVSPTTGPEFYLTEEQIVQNSCTVDRYVVTGDKISYGTACAAELNFKIKNQKFTYNGTEFDPNDIKFEGAKVKVWCVIDNLPANEREIPMGVFTIDEQPRRLSTISLVALDDMVKLDETCSFSVLPSRAEVLRKLTSETGVQVSNNFNVYVLSVVYLNYPKIENCLKEGMGISLASDTEEITWRQLMCWFAELAGGSLIINADGELDVLFFPTSSILDIDESMRYSSDVEENDIEVTGITVKLEDETEKLIGDDTYTYSISGNKLITDTTENIDNADATTKIMANVLDNVFVIYRPFKANMKSFPNLWPMDGVNFCKGDNKYFSIVTHVTWTLNGAMSVESAGLNSTRNGYAKNRTLTSAEKAIIERLSKNTNDKISDFEQAVIKLNDKVNDTGKGLYHTEVEDGNGGTILYTHDMPTLKDSTYITMTTSAGFVFTSGVDCWKDGNPIWQYGFTDYGDMVMNTIAARKISTELLTVGAAKKVTKNLLKNSSFDNGFSGWNKASSTYVDELGVYQYPFYSANIITAYNGNSYVALCPGHESAYPHLDSDPITVLPGKTYTVSFNAQCDIASLMPRVQADVYNSSNQRVSSIVKPSISSISNFEDFVVNPGNFSSYSFEITVPDKDDSYYVILRLYTSRFSTSEDLADDYLVRFDDIQLIGEVSIANKNVLITEDEISILNGRITIYSDAAGERPVFMANADGSLRILGDLRAEGSNYDMVCANVTYNSESIDIDSQGLFQVAKGAEIPNTLTDIQTIPYIRFVDEITSDVMKRNLEINSLNDINIFSQDSAGSINIKALQIAAGTAVLNIGNINCTGQLWVSDENAIGVNGEKKFFEGYITEVLIYLIDRYNYLYKRVTDEEAEDPGYIKK